MTDFLYQTMMSGKSLISLADVIKICLGIGLRLKPFTNGEISCNAPKILCRGIGMLNNKFIRAITDQRH